MASYFVLGETIPTVNSCAGSSSLSTLLFDIRDSFFLKAEKSAPNPWKVLDFPVEGHWEPFPIFAEEEATSEKFGEPFFWETANCKLFDQPSLAGSCVSAHLWSVLCLPGLHSMCKADLKDS